MEKENRYELGWLHDRTVRVPIDSIINKRDSVEQGKQVRTMELGESRIEP